MPIIGAFIGAIAAGLGSLAAAVSGAIGGLVGSFGGLSAFLSSPLGSLIVGIGLQLISSLFVRKPQTPSIEATKVNVRIAEPERWDHCSQNRSGGGVLFAEYDEEGYFWYLVVHSDCPVTETDGDLNIVARYLDDIEVTLDINGNVITDDFCLNDDHNIYTGSGTRHDKFRMFTTTYTESDPTPPAVAELAAAFPGVDGWTSDHKLVGTTYTVMRCEPVKLEHRYKVYRWRGPVGLGEPAIAIVADYSYVYDPRDGTQTLGNRATYKPSDGNSALVWAWFRTLRYGRNKSEASINWTKLATQADVCDEDVLDLNGFSHKRYRSHVAIPESKERSTAEMEIIVSCDGQLVFEDDGTVWLRVGKYEAPTLRLTKNRDIVTMESVEAQDGEAQTQGVIVRYIDRDAKYSAQPSAAWYNPLYYDPAKGAKFLVLDCLAIQDHNQAMRIAKAYGTRSQPAYRILPTVGLRGLRARKERIFDLVYDNTFAGDHEIATVLEVDPVGVFCGFGAVPILPTKWDLLPGEEKQKPVTKEITIVKNLDLPTGITILFRNNRIEVTFTPSPREDWHYEWQYKKSTDTAWIDMLVNMDENIAISGVPAFDVTYNTRYRTLSSGGRGTNWQNGADISTILFTTPPLDLITFSVVAELRYGFMRFNIGTQDDPNLNRVHIYLTPAGNVLNKAVDKKIVVPALPQQTFQYAAGDTSRVNLAVNSDFALTTSPPTLGTGWSLTATPGKATRSGGTGGSISWSGAGLSSATILTADILCLSFTIDSISGSGATLTPRNSGTSTEAWTVAYTTTGLKQQQYTALGPNSTFGLLAASNTVCQIDDLSIYKKTATCLNQGTYDVYAFPANPSGVEGNQFAVQAGYVVR